MAKYNVDHSCGHSAIVNLVGKHKLREYRLEKMADQECSDCFTITLAKQHQAESEKAAAAASELAFPALEGSEKQVAWATTIRQTKWKRVEQLIAVRLENPKMQAEAPEKLLEWSGAQRSHARAHLFDSVVSAKFWIDYRERDVGELIRMAADLS
jgi:hypothetical protein